MVLSVRFVPTQNGPIAVAEPAFSVLNDRVLAARFRDRLSRHLGGMSVALRFKRGPLCAVDGDETGQRYALDPMVETLPRVRVVLDESSAHQGVAPPLDGSDD